MFETDLDVMDESSTSEFETDIIETADDAAGDPGSDDTTTGQGDIQDTTQSAQTVPYDRFAELNNENKQLREQINKILELQLNTARPQHQQTQEFRPKSDDEIIAEVVGEDAFLTPQHMVEIMRRKDEQSNRITSMQSMSQRESMLTQHEAVFRQTNPDYDDVIANIPQHITRALMQSIDNPAVLVAEAYKLGKAYSPAKTSASQVVKQANAQPQMKPKPVSAQQIKGGAAPKNNEDQWLDENFNRL